MNKKLFRQSINYVMAVSLVLVMLTGMLLRPVPNMWFGIIHAISGLVLTISIVIHCLQHRPRHRTNKKGR